MEQNQTKIRVLLFLTPFYPKYGVMNIVLGWAEKYDYQNFDVTIACYTQDEKELKSQLHNFPNIKVFTLPNLAKFNTIYITQIIALKRLFKHNKFDIIHTIFIQADIIGAICKKIFKIPVHVSSIMGELISSVSGSKITRVIKRRIYCHSYRIFCKRIDCYFPITTTSMNQLQTTFKLKNLKFETIYSGVPTNVVPKNKRTNIVNLGVASQLIYEKGIDIVIKALPQIISKNSNIKLFIAGEGREKQNLIELANSLNVSEYVVFEGFVKDMPNFMSKLDIFIFPARPSYDGLPRVILEAMVQKTLVIASKTPEISEILEYKTHNGLTFDVENHINLSNIICSINFDDPKISLIINNAFSIVNSISVEENVMKIQNKYLELLTAIKQ